MPLPAQGQRPTDGQYAGMSAEDIIQRMMQNGFTQEGVNTVYAMRGLGSPPTVPAEGIRRGSGRDTISIYDASGNRLRSGDAARGSANSFFNEFNSTAVDPFRSYNVGNWLGVAGMLAGGYGALTGAGAAGTAAGTAGGTTGTLAGSGAAATTGGLTTSSGLGIFGAGGTGGLAGVGAGNAGALAASGAIAGGAGIGGTTAGSLGGLSRAANAVSGVGGGSMGWWDTVLDLLPVAGSLYNSSQQRDAAGDASNAQLAATREAIAEQRRQFDTSLELLRPQREIGNSAINVLNRLGGYSTDAEGNAASGGTPDMSAFYASPDYEFRRSEGNRDIGNSFAARGGALSGNALRGITDYNSNLASGEFNNFVQRRLQEAGLGGAATSQSVNAAQYTGGNVSNLLAEGGNARASGIINQSNAVTGGLNDLGGWYGNWLKTRRVG